MILSQFLIYIVYISLNTICDNSLFINLSATCSILYLSITEGNLKMILKLLRDVEINVQSTFFWKSSSLTSVELVLLQKKYT